MKRSYSLLVALAVVGIAGCANLDRSRDLANPNVSGDVLAVQVCSICHGVDGNSVSPQFPRLAQQQKEYLVAQLKNFRSHHRSDPGGSEYMWGISRDLTDKQIDELADYFSKQKMAPNAPVDSGLAAAGKDVFENGIPAQKVIACQSCHGPKAQGIGAFPRLANQHADYIVKQLDVFQNTQQRPGTPMEFVVHPLTGSNKEAVAAYLQGFPG
ncbi:MAG TPA: c-type cytochrome [Rhodocyclaceae bacterium]